MENIHFRGDKEEISHIKKPVKRNSLNRLMGLL